MRLSPIRSHLQTAFKGLIVFLLYYAFGKLVYAFRPITNSEIYESLVWPPTGIAVAFLYLWGKKLWPAIFLALVVLKIQQGAPWVIVIGVAFADTLPVILAVMLLKKFRFRAAMDRIRDVLIFSVFAAGISTFLFSFLSIGFMYWGGEISTLKEFFTIVQAWHLGDAVGVMNFGALILIWSTPPTLRRSLMEAGGLLVCSTILTILIFSGIAFPESFNPYLNGYLVFPILIWAALRFGMHGAIFITVYIQQIATLVLYARNVEFHLIPLGDALLSLQAFGGGMITFSTLLLAAAVAERRAMLDSLKLASMAALQASITRSRFLDSMSHEIRTPLTGVLGGIELIQNTELTKEQHRFIDLIAASAKPLLRIVNDILDLSYLESGKATLKKEEIDLRILVKEAIAAVSTNAEKKKLPIRVQIAGVLPKKVIGDQRVLQILINLLSNAVKFTEQGHIELRLSKVVERNGIILVKMEVEDTGIGISEKDRAQLFSPFVQVDQVKQQKTGSGLGLAITKNLVQLMQGGIGVKSQLGSGSVFFVELPFEIPKETGDGNLEKKTESIPVFGSKKILVAEDDPINVQIILLQLEKIGYKADSARNGNEVLQKLENQSYDLILMDLFMPDRDGYATAAEIRKREGTQKHTLIIALTADYLVGTDPNKLRNSGIDDFILKPTRIEILKEMLANYFKYPASTFQSVSFAVNKEAPIDLVLLKELVKGDCQALNFLLQTYFQNFEEDLEALRLALRENNHLELEHLSHKCIGSSGTMGCHDLSRLFRELHQLARDNELNGISSIIQNIEEEMKRIQHYCSEQLEG